MQMPVTCRVLSARAAIRMPHLRAAGAAAAASGCISGSADTRGRLQPPPAPPDAAAVWPPARCPPEHGGLQQVCGGAEAGGAVGGLEACGQRVGPRGRRHRRLERHRAAAAGQLHTRERDLFQRKACTQQATAAAAEAGLWCVGEARARVPPCRRRRCNHRCGGRSLRAAPHGSAMQGTLSGSPTTTTGREGRDLVNDRPTSTAP